MSLDYVTEIEPPGARYRLQVYTHSELLHPETQTHPNTDSTTIRASIRSW